MYEDEEDILSGQTTLEEILDDLLELGDLAKDEDEVIQEDEEE